MFTTGLIDTNLGDDIHIKDQTSLQSVRRRRQLAKQFPLHDIDQEYCHNLSPQELEL